MIVYILLLATILLSYAYSLKGKKTEIALYTLLSLLLCLFAGLRRPGIDADSINYEDFVLAADPIGTYLRSFPDYIFYEPSYYLIASFVKTVGLNPVVFFLIFSCLGTGIKLYAIKEITPLFFLSLIVYGSHFFLVHEMIEIRTGVASGFLFLSLPYVYKRKPVQFVITMLIGMSFHYSLIIALPLYFINSTKLNVPVYLGLIIIPYILIGLGLNVLQLISEFDLGVLSDKLKLYSKLLDEGEFNAINIFNVQVLLQMTLCTIFIFKWRLLQKKNIYSVVLIKTYVYSIACFVFFSPLPVFAFRFAGLLGTVEIILVPFLIYIIEPRSISYAIVFLIALLLFGISLFYAKYLEPYSLNI